MKHLAASAVIAMVLAAPSLSQASMIGNYRQITPKQLEELKNDPAKVPALIDPEAPVEKGAALDVDKAWHGLHYLLAGVAEGGAPPLSYAVLGGTEIGGDVGYGPARYLTPDQVKQAAQALAGLDEPTLRSRFSPEGFAQADIYPVELWEDDTAFEYLLENFASLSIFFQDASARGNAVLFYLN